MANYLTMGSTRQSDENMDDDDDKDDTKRKSRNLSEKKRRDQFNMLVNELGNMVTTNTRKMDKSTVLKSTILFLKNHNEIVVKSRIHEIQEEWKPSFLSNEEFTHLILEALDGFIIVFSSSGRIYYASESVTSLLGYLPSELTNATIYEITYQNDQPHLYNVLLNTGNNDVIKEDDNKVSFACHMKRGGLDFREAMTYELVQFNGYFRSDVENLLPNNRIESSNKDLVFVGTASLRTPQLIRDMSFVDKSEFTSRHSLEWKFLFLDHRAPPIIGYLPFEVLGTSGYDYYHVDDLDKVVTCHESLMLKGEGTSCHYRFLTKGQQWIWLQTRFYIDYNQWNSKPEFIVCTHSVLSYGDVVVKEQKSRSVDCGKSPRDDNRGANFQPTSNNKAAAPVIRGYHDSDTNSVSAGSQSSRHSVSTTHSSKFQQTTSTKSTPHQSEAPPKLRRQTELDQSILSVVPTFIAPAAVPAAPISLSTSSSTVLVNQQMVMTTAQNQIQDELQRKHEQLEQLIVHQQQELKRVSEQLLIARYGILSPLINVGLPYNSNTTTTTTTRCCTSPNVAGTNSAPTDSIHGINLVAVPVTLPTVVSVDNFSHASTVLPVDEAATVSHHHRHAQQQQQQQPNEDNHLGQIMSYQICPPSDIIYDTAASAQQRQNRN